MLNDTRDKVHKQLYDRALEKMIADKEIDVDSYRFIELPASYYTDPSSVAVISKEKPKKTIKIYLAQWWDDYYYTPENTNALAYTFGADETELSTCEIIAIDYVKGLATIRSRYTGKTIQMNLKEVPDNMPRSDDFSRDTTFTEQYLRINK